MRHMTTCFIYNNFIYMYIQLEDYIYKYIYTNYIY